MNKTLIPKLMKHVYCDAYGGPQVMKFKESPLPIPKAHEVLIRVKGTAINRADTLQRQGKYAPPPGSTDIMGLEVTGNIVGENFELGDDVIALLPGGGYAQYVAVNKGHIIKKPKSMCWEEAAGTAEAYLTAHQLINLGGLKNGDTCLVYAAASGVGIALLQLCRSLGIKTIATCSTNKMNALKDLTPNILDRGLSNEVQLVQIKKIVENGVNAVLDPVGQSNVQLTLESLGLDGKWVIYGLMSGHLVEQFSLNSLLRKRIQIIPTTLRSRSDEYKTQLVQDFVSKHYSHLEQGLLRPQISRIVEINWDNQSQEQFQKLHEDMEANLNIGKLVAMFKD